MESSAGARYAARLAALAASGRDMHGEARFCAALLEPGARVLDAGCGTGRVAARLAELGFDCVGVDLDEGMLAVARAVPGVRWLRGDLAELDLDERFDLVVAAGNVVPLVADPAGVMARLAAHTHTGGLVVAGFGLDDPHLPPGAVVIALPEYDRWCADLGLALRSRHATWDGDPYLGGGYAVSVWQVS